MTDWMNSSPMPGHWKTVSVISAKAIRLPICMPVTVITGIRQLRRARRKCTMRSGKPRARANLMNSVRSVSSISARTRRMINVIWNSASVIDGSTSAARPEGVSRPVVHQPIFTVSPRPKPGSQPSCTEKIRISMIPTTKLGSEMPRMETNCSVCARRDLR